MTAQTETAATASGSCCGGSASAGSCQDQGAAGVTAVYRVSGMTCGHCEGAVAAEISALAGVTSAVASASAGTVTVVSAAPLDEEAVRAAVDEAGYELTGAA
ncbi:heavy-metal-associated domain-containing protein [Streptomyces sp. NA04227]|uniref:heavy-metal-associated domain-containing protein n=1 Tax=Streptomyces sp. NA04227 TaxID=2742136 RepID=UPI001591CAA2|nr:heavy-metal-associated domain-containing protein [Streptomyces sp. NA04227]QKW08814.1 heavy-metal-associated domain-containing protein [Streptomyces sp. NA04227]